MTKSNLSYADQCLQRAEKATEGPWTCSDIGSIHSPSGKPIQTGGPECESETCYANALHIAHGRTDVPELARRLKEAIEALRSECSYDFDQIADRLEAMPEQTS